MDKYRKVCDTQLYIRKRVNQCKTKYIININMSNNNTDTKKYICELCGIDFWCYKSYWSHINRKKGACISKEKCLEIIKEKEQKDIALVQKDKVLEQKDIALEQKEKVLEETQKELQTLRDILSKTNVKNDIETVKHDFEQLGVLVKESINKEKMLAITNNNTLNNNVVLNNTNPKDMVFDMQFTERGAERVDHIDGTLMKTILSHEKFDDTLNHVAKAIFFHPEAPQNWKWCVIDKNAQHGCLEFEKELRNAVRKMAGEVINENMRHAIFQITDLLGDFERKKLVLNDRQKYNRERLFDRLGVDFTPEQVNGIKEVAYAGRNLVKSLWESVGIGLEAVPITCKIKYI